MRSNQAAPPQAVADDDHEALSTIRIKPSARLAWMASAVAVGAVACTLLASSVPWLAASVTIVIAANLHRWLMLHAWRTHRLAIIGVEFDPAGGGWARGPTGARRRCEVEPGAFPDTTIILARLRFGTTLEHLVVTPDMVNAEQAWRLRRWLCGN